MVFIWSYTTITFFRMLKYLQYFFLNLRYFVIYIVLWYERNYVRMLYTYILKWWWYSFIFRSDFAKKHSSDFSLCMRDDVLKVSVCLPCPFPSCYIFFFSVRSISAFFLLLFYFAYLYVYVHTKRKHADLSRKNIW